MNKLQQCIAVASIYEANRVSQELKRTGEDLARTGKYLGKKAALVGTGALAAAHPKVREGAAKAFKSTKDYFTSDDSPGRSGITLVKRAAQDTTDIA